MSLITNGLIQDGLITNGLINSGLIGDGQESLFDKLQDLSQPLIVAYEGQDPAETGRYPQESWCCEFVAASSQYVDLPNLGGVGGEGSMWFNTDLVDTQGLFSYGNSVANGYVYITGGKVRVYGGASFIDSSNGVVVGQWHFVEWTILDGQALSVKLDGVETIGNIPIVSAPVGDRYIGTHYNAGSQFFDGKIVGVTDNGATVNLQESSGTTAYCSDKVSHGTLVNGVTRVADPTMPMEADANNEEGFSSDYENDINSSSDLTAGFVYNAAHISVVYDGEWSKIEALSSDLSTIDHSLPTGAVVRTMFVTLKKGTSTSLATQLSGMVNPTAEVVSGSGSITVGSRFIINDLDENETVVKLSAGCESNVFFYAPTRTHVAGDSVYVKNIQLYDGDASAVRPRFVETTGTPFDSNTIIPAADATTDALGNALEFKGSVYPTVPEREGSNAVYINVGVVDKYITTGLTFASATSGSLSFYIKPDSVSPSTTSYIAGCRDSTDTRCLFAFVNSKLSLAIGSSVNTATGGALTLVVGEVYHVSAIWDGVTVSVYIDETLDKQYAQSGNTGTINDFILGTFNDAGTPFTTTPIPYKCWGLIVDGVSMPLTEGAGTTAHATDGTTTGTLVNGPTWTTT